MLTLPELQKLFILALEDSISLEKAGYSCISIEERQTHEDRIKKLLNCLSDAELEGIFEQRVWNPVTRTEILLKDLP